MMSDNFTNGVLVGLIIGLLIGGILGGFWNIYRRWIRERDAARKPQLVMHPTAKTPSQVINAAARAQAKIYLSYFVIFLIFWIVIETFFVPGLTEYILSLFAQVLYQLTGYGSNGS